MADSISVKQKEAKTISFTISGTFFLSGTTFKFAVKKSKSDAAYVIEKDDADFDKTEIASRIVKVKVSAADLNQTAGQYTGELRITFASDNIDKSGDIDFEIIGAVIT